MLELVAQWGAIAVMFGGIVTFAWCSAAKAGENEADARHLRGQIRARRKFDAAHQAARRRPRHKRIRRL